LAHFIDHHRGYGFLEYEEEEDAAHALENMDGSELMGRTISVRVARSMMPQMTSTKQAIWTSETFHHPTNEENEEKDGTNTKSQNNEEGGDDENGKEEEGTMVIEDG